MKEKEFIKTIKNVLDSKYIGDDCAYLKDLGIVVTQDSLVEDVHFSTEFATAYQIGFKSVMVNISDVCASGAEPKYLTIALSLPNDIEENFVEEFYKGAKEAAGTAEIVGGDITGADKIYISVTAIGSTKERKISSRSAAKVGQKVVVAGVHGSSAAGLRMLLEAQKSNEAEGKTIRRNDDKLFNDNSLSSYPLICQSSNEDCGKSYIAAHLMPQAQLEFSRRVGESVKEDYAMMDTSDGLMDALSAIAEASGVMLEIDFEKIPYDFELEKISGWEDLVLFGGEDYGLVATLPEDFGGIVIGEVKQGSGVKVNYGSRSSFYTRDGIEKKLFKHFKE